MKSYLAILLILLIPMAYRLVIYIAKPTSRFPYQKKNHFLTPTEQKFYLMLAEWFGNTYYIFPQIHLSSLIEVIGSERKQYTYLNKIDRKSIDFVLFDKLNMLPVLAIELDDYTHKFEKRRKRDIFIDEVFSGIGFPIAHVCNIKESENVREYLASLLTKSVD